MFKGKRFNIVLAVLGLLLGHLAVICCPQTASAMPPYPYEQPLFDQFRDKGDQILLIFCSDESRTCFKQADALNQLLDSVRFYQVRSFVVPFNVDVVKLWDKYRVKQEGTMVLVDSSGEVARSKPRTDPEQLERFLERAVR